MGLPITRVKLTTGFGNNLFQYSFARLLANYHGNKLQTNGIKAFSISDSYDNLNKSFETIKISNLGYKTGIYDKYFSKKYSKKNHDISKGYFEDYTIYTPHRKEIIKWFKTNLEYDQNDDLIIHFRLQNRLVQTSHFLNLIDPQFIAYYISTILKPSQKLYICTDSSVWEDIDQSYILNIHKEVKLGENSGSPLVPVEYSVKFFNLLVKALSIFSPIVITASNKTIRGSGGLRSDFIQSFNTLRSFRRILFFNSTFAWWAAFLNIQSEAHFFSSWKPSRINKCPNLGETKLENWQSFGSPEVLYTKTNNIKVENPNTKLNWFITRLKSKLS